MKKIYVFGNEYLEIDNFAGIVAKQLSDFGDLEFIHCTHPDDLLDSEDKLVILDVVKNITEPIIITDPSKLKINNIVSLHDFDLGYFLNLMKELDMDKDIKIIGIPMTGDAKEVAMRVKLWL